MSTLLTKPPSCEGCPAASLGLGYVPPSGPLDAPLYLLGQGPGRTEAEGFWDIPSQSLTRAPFIGRAGAKLDDWMRRAGWPARWREIARLDNTVRCWLRKGNKDLEPTPRMVDHCRRAHWGADWKAHPRALTLAIGTTAIKATYGPWAGERVAGSLVEWEGPGA